MERYTHETAFSSPDKFSHRHAALIKVIHGYVAMGSVHRFRHLIGDPAGLVAMAEQNPAAEIDGGNIPVEAVKIFGP
jgi:hypothetical protein|tara:strand:+ start:142 stop:372 length:231 start_codon:yes stop_codon:yes gene_type:complete